MIVGRRSRAAHDRRVGEILASVCAEGRGGAGGPDVLPPMLSEESPVSRDLSRLHEADPDPEAEEIALAQAERATFDDLLDAHARAGTEPMRAVKASDDGAPLNEGAARAYRVAGDLGGAADGTGIGVTMTDGPSTERTDLLGAPAEVLMAGPTTSGHGSGSSSKIKKDRGRPTVAEINARRDREIRERPSDYDKAKKAIAEHAPSDTGRPLKGDGPRVKIGRVDSQLIVSLQEAGCGENVDDQLRFTQELIESGLTFAEFVARKKGEARADEPGKGAA